MWIYNREWCGYIIGSGVDIIEYGIYSIIS